MTPAPFVADCATVVEDAKDVGTKAPRKPMRLDPMEATAPVEPMEADAPAPLNAPVVMVEDTDEDPLATAESLAAVCDTPAENAKGAKLLVAVPPIAEAPMDATAPVDEIDTPEAVPDRAPTVCEDAAGVAAARSPLVTAALFVADCVTAPVKPVAVRLLVPVGAMSDALIDATAPDAPTEADDPSPVRLVGFKVPKFWTVAELVTVWPVVPVT